MTLITLEEADHEFVESVDYYESREPGLGVRFRDEVAAVVDWITRFPELPRLRRKGYRRVNGFIDHAYGFISAAHTAVAHLYSLGRIDSVLSSACPSDLLTILFTCMDYRDIITIEPGKRSGMPCIRGTRMTVTDVLESGRHGQVIAEVT